jgi:hypothetical protein
MTGEGWPLCAGECSMNYWCGEASTSSTQNECPSHSESSAGSGMITNCLCSRGYDGSDGGACEACSAGKSKNVIGSSRCEECSIGRYSDGPSLLIVPFVQLIQSLVILVPNPFKTVVALLVFLFCVIAVTLLFMDLRI